MAPDESEDYRSTYWDTLAPRSAATRCVRGLTYRELKQRIGFPDSLRERLDADVWPPALEWAGYMIEFEENEDQEAARRAGERVPACDLESAAAADICHLERTLT